MILLTLVRRFLKKCPVRCGFCTEIGPKRKRVGRLFLVKALEKNGGIWPYEVGWLGIAFASEGKRKAGDQAEQRRRVANRSNFSAVDELGLRSESRICYSAIVSKV